MYEKTVYTFLLHFLVLVLSFEDIFYVNGQINQEVIEHGREQYQLFKTRSTLPKYGPCWKAAVEHLDEGCRYLSEDTQSDIALHITNCFLEMSGHETYNCELDKKPNLRAICINSMSDRAFNVYTEFYTHTQNICWFLRGQIWHETIAENTVKVGKQLVVTAQNQEDLLKAQKESMELQEKMLQQGKFLEQVMEDLHIASKTHQEILKVMSQSVSNLQAWIVGEVSWIDSIIFYGMTIFVTFVITSSHRTMSARLPVFLLLFLNLVIERLICSSILSNSDDVNVREVYNNIYEIVWYSRYTFIFISMLVLIYRTISHKNLAIQNNLILRDIRDQNHDALNILNKLKNVLIPNKHNVDVIDESLSRKLLDKELNISDKVNVESPSRKSSIYKFKSYSPLNDYKESSGDSTKENYLDYSGSYNSNKRRFLPFNELQNRYNLRSKQSTPDSVHC